MKLEMRLRAGDDIRAVWLLAFCILVGGSYYVQTRCQTAIGASHDRTEALYRRTVADARIIRQSVRLRRIQTRAIADLTQVSRDTSLSGTTAQLLSILHASAQTFHTRILELQPGNAQAAEPQNDDNLAGKALRATSLTIRVQGKFRNILGFVEDLSHHATLVNVSDTEMALATDESGEGEPRLDATIHATLYRLAMPDDKELRLASAG